MWLQQKGHFSMLHNFIIVNDHNGISWLNIPIKCPKTKSNKWKLKTVVAFAVGVVGESS